MQGSMFAAIWRYELNDARPRTSLYFHFLHQQSLTKILYFHWSIIDKLFDFGFCKELVKSLYDKESGMYKLTQLTGSPPYMVSCTYVILILDPKQLQKLTCIFLYPHQAPENFLGKPYGKPVDVFSFGVLVWEMIHCKLAVRFTIPQTCCDR
jgi:serine/threonine protein kinase